MTETRALTIRAALTPSVWEMVQSVAPVIHQSRLFGVNSPQQAAAIMLKGFELGMGLTASFELIQVVQGKPTLSPRGALALIHQSPELAGLKITEKTGSCTVWMKRQNGVEYELTWTMEDAQRTGQVKPDSAWATYPGNMLRWRCIGFVADVVFPDVIGGMKRADELGAQIDREGNVIEGTWAPAPPAVPPAPAAPAPNALSSSTRATTKPPRP